MTLVEIAALLVVLSAALGWANHVFIGLPHAIGLLIMGLVGSICLLAADYMMPGMTMARDLDAAIESIDFFDTVMNGMLSFLLFAAALHVDVKSLRSQRASILLMATAGVLISTAVIGIGLWLLAGLTGVDIPLAWALVFGALISPTDPVAVLSVLKTVKVPRSLQAKIAGESLFNDGVGVVAFTVMLAVALASSGAMPVEGHKVVDVGGSMDFFVIAKVFALEVFGAVALGIATGAVALCMVRKVDDPAIATLITLALVLGTYVAATWLHFSGPIAVVLPGLVIGNWGTNTAKSKQAKDHLFPFWSMVDEILNSVLFLLIGLEVLAIRFHPDHAALALLCVPLVLVARYVSVSLPAGLLRGIGKKYVQGAIAIMTWGGVRGGVSVALALSLPASEYKGAILTATYVVVVFSIVVQGLTIAPLVRMLSANSDPA